MKLTESIAALKGVGDKTASKLAKLNIHTVGDLVQHYPREYQDKRQVSKISEIVNGQVHHIIAQVASIPQVMKKGYRVMVRFRIKDDSGALLVVFFGQPYLKNQFNIGETYIFTGKVKYQYNCIELESPVYEKLEKGQEADKIKITPIYPTTAKLSQKAIRHLILEVLESVKDQIQENLPLAIRQREGLVDKQYALQNIHFPESQEAFFKARRRLVFEELFLLQLALYVLKSDFAQRNKGRAKKIPKSLETFIKALPFQLTGAQNKVIQEILKDLSSDYAMNRLIQGDVGSGAMCFS